MSFEATIVNGLSQTAMTGLVGLRVRPINVAQGETRPYLAYSIGDSEDPSPSHDGPSSFTRTEYDVITVADTYIEAAAISAVVRSSLNGFKGNFDGTSVVWTRFTGETDVEQQPEPGTEKPLYVRSQTFRAMHRPT